MLAMPGRGSILSTPDSNGISMLETLLFIAAAIPLVLQVVANTKRTNEVSRRRSIIGKVPLLWSVGGLVFNCLFMRQLYTRIESALFNAASKFIAYPGVAKPTCGVWTQRSRILPAWINN